MNLFLNRKINALTQLQIQIGISLPVRYPDFQSLLCLYNTFDAHSSGCMIVQKKKKGKSFASFDMLQVCSPHNCFYVAHDASFLFIISRVRFFRNDFWMQVFQINLLSDENPEANLGISIALIGEFRRGNRFPRKGIGSGV